MKAILGKKIDMSQAVTTAGLRIPVTRIQAGPVVVTALKTEEKDGYMAVQIGLGESKHPTKALQGHLKGSAKNPSILREIRINKEEELKVGDTLKVADVFRKGEVVDVTATSKGKGFAGGIKRHGFHGGPKTHGQSDRHRAPGSIGSTTTPGRVFKGKKMAGRMGGEQVTTQGLEIIEIGADDVLVVKGAVPGPRGNLVIITKSDKKKKIYHGPQIQALPHGDEEVESDEAKEGGEAPVEAGTEAPTPAPVKEPVTEEGQNG
jgi:large subunit ribosomal protein L3